MDETLTQMRTMTSAAELNSEKAAPEENGGPNPDREAAAASSAGPEAAPAVEAAAAPGEEPRVSDVGEAKAKVAQPVERGSGGNRRPWRPPGTAKPASRGR